MDTREKKNYMRTWKNTVNSLSENVSDGKKLHIELEKREKHYVEWNTLKL